jgi:hypothetical protein
MSNYQEGEFLCPLCTTEFACTLCEQRSQSTSEFSPINLFLDKPLAPFAGTELLLVHNGHKNSQHI